MQVYVFRKDYSWNSTTRKNLAGELIKINPSDMIVHEASLLISISL